MRIGATPMMPADCCPLEQELRCAVHLIIIFTTGKAQQFTLQFSQPRSLQRQEHPPASKIAMPVAPARASPSSAGSRRTVGRISRRKAWISAVPELASSINTRVTRHCSPDALPGRAVPGIQPDPSDIQQKVGLLANAQVVHTDQSLAPPALLAPSQLCQTSSYVSGARSMST